MKETEISIHIWKIKEVNELINYRNTLKEQELKSQGLKRGY